MSNDLKDPSEVSEDRAFREHMGEVNPQDYDNFIEVDLTDLEEVVEETTGPDVGDGPDWDSDGAIY